jgi:hypothetical protein
MYLYVEIVQIVQRQGLAVIFHERSLPDPAFAQFPQFPRIKTSATSTMHSVTP